MMDPGSFEAAVVVVLGCLLLGLLLIAIEVIVVPGISIPGVLGAGLLLFAVGWAFWQGGTLWGLLTLAVAGTILYLALRVAGLVLGHRIVLGTDLGPVATSDLDELVGRTGVALSPLRPAGIARFGVRRVDVTSRSEFLGRGASVRCVTVEGNRVTVEAAEPAKE
jgi:membrane-bound serine protease (ClpP class)